MAGVRFSVHVHGMKASQYSPSLHSQSSGPQKPIAVVDVNQSKTAIAPSPEAVARLAYTFYKQQGSQPGHEVKHWLEAEAQLVGGLERETQMHPGSSLFTTEH